MTNAEIRTALVYEARELGHAEARTIGKESVAQSLVSEGKFVLGGTIGGVTLRNGERARWYKLAPGYSAEPKQETK